mgnify:FL=1
MLFVKQTLSSPLLTVYRDYTTRDAADSIMNINNILTKVKPVNRKHTRSKWPLAASQMTACKINPENTKENQNLVIRKEQVVLNVGAASSRGS